MVIPFDEALSLVAASAPRLPTEPVPLAQAAGRVLGEPVRADLDVPPFETTAMDGWAVRLSDVHTVPARLAGSGVVGAGAVPEALRNGSALKLMTGAPVPEGADAIVPVEEAREAGDGVEILVAPKLGAHIRRRGEVLRAGQELLSPGRALAPADLVLAAAAGRETLAVTRRPRAACLVTGDEIVPAGARPSGAQIRNTNGPLIEAALRRLGAEVRDLGVARDDRDLLASALASALEGPFDLVVTSGGVSAGDFDLVGAVLRELGAEVIFHKVSIRPAKPTLFARKGSTMIFGLPGNPVSAAVALDLFVRAALRQAAGLLPPLPPPREAELLSPVRNKGSRLAFLPAVVAEEKGRLFATPIATKGSHDVLSHALSNAYLVLPPASAFARGDRVPVLPGEATLNAV